jgi:hypothetical protein
MQTSTGRDRISNLDLDLWDDILLHLIPPEAEFEIRASFEFGHICTKSYHRRPCMDIIGALLPLTSISKTIRQVVFESSVCRHISFFRLQHYGFNIRLDQEACRGIDRLVDAVRGARSERQLYLTLDTSSFDYYRAPNYLGSRLDELLSVCKKVDLRVTASDTEGVVSSILCAPESCLTHLAITTRVAVTWSHLLTDVTSTPPALQHLHLDGVNDFDVGWVKHFQLQSLRLHSTTIPSLQPLLSLITREQCPTRLSIVDVLVDEPFDRKALGISRLSLSLTHLQVGVSFRGIYLDLLELLDYCSVAVFYACPEEIIQDGRVLDTLAVENCTWIKAKGSSLGRMEGSRRRLLNCWDLSIHDKQLARVIDIVGGSGEETLVNLTSLGSRSLLVEWLRQLKTGTSVVVQSAMDNVIWRALCAANVTSVEFNEVMYWEVGDLEGVALPSNTTVVVRKCVSTFAVDIVRVMNTCTISLEDIYDTAFGRDESQDEIVDMWLREVELYFADLLRHPDEHRDITPVPEDSDEEGY